MIPEAEAGGGVGDLVAVVARRWWLVVAGLVVATVVATVMVALQTPRYRAEARVLIDTQPDTAFGAQSVPAATAQRAVQTEVQVIASSKVAAEVQRLLDLPSRPPAVQVSIVGQTDVVALRVTAGDPTTARLLADAYALAYVEVTREADVAALEQARHEVEVSVAGLDAQLAELADQLEGATGAPRDELTDRQASLRVQRDQLQGRLAELDVDISLQDGGGSVVRQATAGSSAISPTPLPTVGLAALVGALVGVLGAVAVARVDRGIRTSAELEAAADTIGLGELPLVKAPDNRPMAVSTPDDPFVEQVRTLRAGIGFAAMGRPTNALLVTSALPGEGKSSVAANLAFVSAENGKRVVLVDADLRRPSLSAMLALPPHAGLSDVLLGEAIDPCLVEVVHGVFVLPSGARPPNPAGLFAGDRFEALLADLRSRFDVVVFDSPPVLPVTDALSIATMVDGVVLVARAGETGAEQVRRAAERLRLARGDLLGVVLNGVDRRDAARLYGYGYGMTDS